MKKKVRDDYYIEIHHDEDEVPKEKTHSHTSTRDYVSHKTKARSGTSRRRVTPKKRTHTQVHLPKNFGIYVLVLILVLLYFTYDAILLFFLTTLESNPLLYQYYLYVESHIANNTLQGLFAISALGSLFFLSLPAEIVFIYYISTVGMNPFIVLGITLAGTMVGLLFNYLFGLLVGEQIVRMMFRRSFPKYQNLVQKYGGYILVLGNIVPGPIELVSVFFGAFRYNLRYYLYLSLIGRLIKLCIVLVLYFLFWDQVIAYYDSIVQNLAVLKNFYNL